MLNTNTDSSANKCVHNNLDYGFEIYSNKNENSFILYTQGLSKYKQQVNEQNEAYQRIELYVCLPEYWNLAQDSWPIHYLNLIAQIPQKNETWLGLGDTIPAGNPVQNICDKSEMNHFILSKPRFALNDLISSENCRYLAVVPIFQTELDYKLRNSATILFQKLEKAGVTEMVDLYRKSVCRKRILGLI